MNQKYIGFAYRGLFSNSVCGILTIFHEVKVKIECSYTICFGQCKTDVFATWKSFLIPSLCIILHHWEILSTSDDIYMAYCQYISCNYNVYNVWIDTYTETQTRTIQVGFISGFTAWFWQEIQQIGTVVRFSLLRVSWRKFIWPGRIVCGCGEATLT